MIVASHYKVSMDNIRPWTPGTPYECDELKLCTPSNMTWRYQNPHGFYNKESVCRMLQSKYQKQSDLNDSNKIFSISLMGDSFMRHLTTALAMSLTGKVEGFHFVPSGNVEQDKATMKFIEENKCYDGNEQYGEKSCSFLGINHLPESYCDGHLTISYCADPTIGATISLISYHNGIVDPYGVESINNSTLNMEHLENMGICARDKVFKFPTFVISTHYRINEYKGLGKQDHEDIEQYNDEMRHFIEVEKRCGNAIYVDVYNMTKALVLNHYNDSLSMTFDRVHYTRNVNLLKAQIVLERINQLIPFY